MMTEKRSVIESVVTVFETGRPTRDARAYSTLVVLDDGAGFSYGLHQSTDHSSSLDVICRAYVDASGVYADDITPHLPRLARDESRGLASHRTGSPWPPAWPEWAADLATALVRAGADPLMQRVQDEVFSEHYWTPATEQREAMGLTYPLSWLAIYDTVIHNGASRIWSLRKQFAASPPAEGGDEQVWLRAFLQSRRDYILGLNTETKRKSAVRCDALLSLCERRLWGLPTPLGIEAPMGWTSQLRWSGTAELFRWRWPYEATVGQP